MSEPKKIQCPGCGQDYTARVEHIGLEMECASCGHVFKIPNLLNISSIGTAADQQERAQGPSEEELLEAKKLNTAVYDSLSDDEKGWINQEGAELVARLGQLKKRHSWEYAVVAQLLHRRLAPLRQATTEQQYEQQIQTGWKQKRDEYNTFVKEHCRLLMQILCKLDELLGQPLTDALSKDELYRTFDLANKIYEQLQKLQQFHAQIYVQPLPQDETYTTIQSIMITWVPEICQSLDGLINRIHQSSNKMRDSNNFEAQISLAPTSLFRLLKISSKLKMGFEQLKTVQLDLSK